MNFKFIEPSYEIIPIPDPYEKIDVLSHLERIGRVCYKSEDKITRDSSIKFIKMLRDRKHWAMLEHYRFVISVPKYIYESIVNIPSELHADPGYTNALKFITTTHWTGYSNSKLEYIVSGSATAFNNLWNTEWIKSRAKFYPEDGIIQLCNFMKRKHNELMLCPYDNESVNKYVSPDIFFLGRDDIKYLPRDLRLIHDTMTVKYIVDRGVSHELVRHRPCSWAQESTRYVNYGSKGEFTFVIPNWIEDEFKQILLETTNYGEILVNIDKLPTLPGLWFEAMYNAAVTYNTLTAAGEAAPGTLWTAQQARSVLPNSIKTEIIQTATLQEWIHFFKMRADKPAHPQMREVVVPLLKECINTDPRIFGGLEYLYEDLIPFLDRPEIKGKRCDIFMQELAARALGMMVSEQDLLKAKIRAKEDDEDVSTE